MDSKVTIDGSHLYVKHRGRHGVGSVSAGGGGQVIKSKAFINAIPMQDYQLEKWR
jgi:hypothetical protein